MPISISSERLAAAYRHARTALVEERTAAGHWEGELSTSALSTATAVMALEMVRRYQSPPGLPHGPVGPFAAAATQPGAAGSGQRVDYPSLIEAGLSWIAAHQNGDGGWGDTTLSHSNISTTMLCHAAFYGGGAAERYAPVVQAARNYIDRAGGVVALRARYGKDQTFSIPILTHCALAGLVDWKDVAALPFELACVPARLYRWVRMPVVSYALPALIAIGQVRYHFLKPRFVPLAMLRNAARGRSLRILEQIQPRGGGFLEAAPLTSFVTMSLAGMGLADHPVACRGVEFLVRSVRPDGSWPIDTNLATWATTLSINALGDDLPPEAVPLLRAWLLNQQYQTVHPYTNSPPGGWAWTDLPGGVPDSDDTPGAILALDALHRREDCSGTRRAMGLAAIRSGQDGAGDPSSAHVQGPGTERATRASAAEPVSAADDDAAMERGLYWLLNLQNRDGGWPTFCRGWGLLPFDRSAPDLTAHCLRALICWMNRPAADRVRLFSTRRARRALADGFRYLAKTQRADGSWLPLWFGNQHVPDDENPTYGTARVLAAYRDAGRFADPAAGRGLSWLVAAQNQDGGWGGSRGTPSSVEETALSLEMLVTAAAEGAVPSDPVERGLEWLVSRVESGNFADPSPIGFYFAKLWYFEKLYPRIFTVAALGRAVRERSR